jgi:hypothetical protein
MLFVVNRDFELRVSCFESKLVSELVDVKSRPEVQKFKNVVSFVLFVVKKWSKVENFYSLTYKIEFVIIVV